MWSKGPAFDGAPLGSVGSPRSSPGNDRRPIIAAALASLVLIAALVGIAWQHRSTFRQPVPVGTAGPSMIHEVPGPIPTGTVINGPSGAPVSWVTVPSDGTRTLTAVPGGVEMALVRPDYSQWQSVPVSGSYLSMVVQADVQFVAGGSDNAIGLGCRDQSTRGQLGFHVHDDRTWTLVYFPPGNGAIGDLDTGYSSAIRPTSRVNSLTVSCVSSPHTRDATRVMAAVNGVTVVNDIVGVSSTGWIPTIDQCSCDGVDTGRFTNMSLFST